MSPPRRTRATTPWLFNTNKQPAVAVGDIPFVVGRLPTMTQPCRKTASAVVRPTPPHALPAVLARVMCAKTDRAPRGDISTIVVPVPCWFLLLKLLTSTSPATRRPVLRGTTATPYGLTSPLAG